MGYYMYQEQWDFKILAKDTEEALAAIKALATQTEGMGGGGWFSWVSTNEFLEAKTLSEALDSWRWEADLAENGDVVGLTFIGEKLGDDAILFAAIAPFVVSDSYIHMRGEDGTNWRWLFRGGVLLEQIGRVVFDE